MEKENDYLVRNPKLIAEYLSSIFKSNCIISAHFGENNTTFLTVITELDPKKNILKVDCAPTELLNKQLLGSTKVLFRTQMDGIKISFSGKNIKKCKSGEHPAFEMPIPDAIFWMQRRNYFRIKIPLSHTGSYCNINLITNPDEVEETPPIIEKSSLRLADLSIKGFALINSVPNYAGLFETGKEFNECKLHLHEGQNGNIGFIVQNINEIKVNANNKEQRIGGYFTELTPSFESAIQRYMQDIERQLKNIG